MKDLSKLSNEELMGIGQINSFKKKVQVVKSIQNSDKDILVIVKNMFLSGENFDLDPCYSTGKFYEDLERPLKKMDKIPQSSEVVRNDIMNGIPLSNSSIKSIVFDPPFMFEKRHRENLNIMKQRFSMFHGGFEELEQMYKKALSEFYRILIKDGIAAKILNRKFIGIELSEEYLKIAQERIKNTQITEREKEDR